MPPVRRRWDATTLVGMLAVLFGVAWLIGAVGALHVSVEAVVALGLMLLGASLVVTGRTDWSLSRRSWPVLLGVGMIAVLVVTSSAVGIGSALDSISFGDKTVASASTGTVHGGFGNLTVHASGLFTGTLKIVSIAGDTKVDQLPTSFTVDARLVGGEICVNGQQLGAGLGPHVHENIGRPAASLPTLDVHQVFGQIVIGSRGCSHS